MAEFDGIKEREEGKKRMPLAMTILFAALVLFGLAYLYLFSPQTTGWNQIAGYERQIKAQEAAQVKPHPETEATETKEHELQEAIERGKEVYTTNCAVCHGDKLQGGVGPALTGATFKYGSSVEDHIKVISAGTPNGMPSFEKQLGAHGIYNVAAYIHSQH